jgi:hypothetical protein
MATDSLIKLAKTLEFQLRIEAARKAKKEPPPNVKAEDIKELTEDERELLRMNGTREKFLPHNPPSWAEKRGWDRAKKIVKKYWSHYKDPWSTVADLYFKLGYKKKKSKKSK